MTNHCLTCTQTEQLDRFVENGRFASREDALQAAIDPLDQDAGTADALVNRLEAARAEALADRKANCNGEEVIRRAFASARCQ